jgi:exodeoxyribonuclease VII large subunit
MIQLNFDQRLPWTITELTQYLVDLFHSDTNLGDLWVQGEISNLSRPSSGHMYFTLKDRKSALKCVMWRSTVNQLTYIPQNGDAVQVHGYIDIYPAGGQYQLYVNVIRPVGEGALYQEFLRLKAKLEAEGLFEIERKKPIPYFPQKIGVVTSPTGAALRDILNTIRRRYTMAEVILSPTMVQGDNAPPQIIAALEALTRIAMPDVILLARGGGSIEDLWAFNDEELARAIAASPIPIISGIGHETDFTLADFVSDLRAPTPTAAAERATPDKKDLLAELEDTQERLARLVQTTLADLEIKLDQLDHRLNLLSPLSKISADRQHLDELLDRLRRRSDHYLQLRRTQLDGIQQHLSALDPYSALRRGYSAITLPNGTLVRSIQQVEPQADINVRLYDGSFDAQVSEIHTTNK